MVNNGKFDHRLTEEEQHKRDCFARWLLEKRSADQIRDWLKGQKKPDFREDMRARLNEQKAKT